MGATGSSSSRRAHSIGLACAGSGKPSSSTKYALLVGGYNRTARSSFVGVSWAPGVAFVGARPAGAEHLKCNRLAGSNRSRRLDDDIGVLRSHCVFNLIAVVVSGGKAADQKDAVVQVLRQLGRNELHHRRSSALLFPQCAHKVSRLFLEARLVQVEDNLCSISPRHAVRSLNEERRSARQHVHCKCGSLRRV